MRLSKRSQFQKNTVVAEPVISSMTFEESLAAFLQAQDAQGHSKATSADYKSVIGLFLKYMKKEHSYTSINQITELDIMGWLAYLRNTENINGRSYSPRSISTYCRFVLTFFHWLVAHCYLSSDPTKGIKEPKVDKPLIRVFTKEELILLDSACERAPSGRSVTPDERKMLAARDRAILWLLLSTGIRLSELCGLKFVDVDWSGGMILVRGKGAKERRVPMGPVARQHLNTYIVYWRGTPTNLDEPVFLSVFQKPIADSAVQQMFNRLKLLAGITDKRVSPHTCRHWFAVNSIKNGMPTVVLKNLLGHENWNMIEVYVRLAEQDSRDIYDKFSPVEHLELDHTASDRRKRASSWRNNRKNVSK